MDRGQPTIEAARASSLSISAEPFSMICKSRWIYPGAIVAPGGRMNRSWVIGTAYRTERTTAASTNGHSLAGLGDVLVDTELREGSLLLKASFKHYWPNNEFSL